MRYEDYKESLLAPQEIIEIFKGFEASNYANSIPRDVFFNAVKNSPDAVLYSYEKLEGFKDEYNSHAAEDKLYETDMSGSGLSDEIHKAYHDFMDGWIMYVIGHNGVAYRIYAKNIDKSLLYTGLDDEGEVDFAQTSIIKLTWKTKIRNLYRRFLQWFLNLSK